MNCLPPGLDGGHREGLSSTPHTPSVTQHVHHAASTSTGAAVASVAAFPPLPPPTAAISGANPLEFATASAMSGHNTSALRSHAHPRTTVTAMGGGVDSSLSCLSNSLLSRTAANCGELLAMAASSSASASGWSASSGGGRHGQCIEGNTASAAVSATPTGTATAAASSSSASSSQLIFPHRTEQPRTRINDQITATHHQINSRSTTRTATALTAPPSLNDDRHATPAVSAGGAASVTAVDSITPLLTEHVTHLFRLNNGACNSSLPNTDQPDQHHLHSEESLLLASLLLDFCCASESVFRQQWATVLTGSSSTTAAESEGSSSGDPTRRQHLPGGNDAASCSPSFSPRRDEVLLDALETYRNAFVLASLHDAADISAAAAAAVSKTTPTFAPFVAMSDAFGNSGVGPSATTASASPPQEAPSLSSPSPLTASCVALALHEASQRPFSMWGTGRHRTASESNTQPATKTARRVSLQSPPHVSPTPDLAAKMEGGEGGLCAKGDASSHNHPADTGGMYRLVPHESSLMVSSSKKSNDSADDDGHSHCTSSSHPRGQHHRHHHRHGTSTAPPTTAAMTAREAAEQPPPLSILKKTARRGTVVIRSTNGGGGGGGVTANGGSASTRRHPFGVSFFSSKGAGAEASFLSRPPMSISSAPSIPKGVSSSDANVARTPLSLDASQAQHIHFSASNPPQESTASATFSVYGDPAMSCVANAPLSRSLMVPTREVRVAKHRGGETQKQKKKRARAGGFNSSSGSSSTFDSDGNNTDGSDAGDDFFETLNEYILLEEVGRGQYGRVVMAVHEDDADKRFVIKMIPRAKLRKRFQSHTHEPEEGPGGGGPMRNGTNIDPPTPQTMDKSDNARSRQQSSTTTTTTTVTVVVGGEERSLRQWSSEDEDTASATNGPDSRRSSSSATASSASSSAAVGRGGARTQPRTAGHARHDTGSVCEVRGLVISPAKDQCSDVPPQQLVLEVNKNKTRAPCLGKHAGSSPPTVEDDPLEQEIAVMKKLRHRNIVRLVEVIDDPKDEQLYLVMPYIESGPVLKIENGRCAALEIDVVRAYMKQLLSAVAYLHRNQVVHCDIKPDNVLLGADGRIYLTDFGVCEIFSSGRESDGSDAKHTIPALPADFHGMSIRQSCYGAANPSQHPSQPLTPSPPLSHRPPRSPSVGDDAVVRDVTGTNPRGSSPPVSFSFAPQHAVSLNVAHPEVVRSNAWTASSDPASSHLSHTHTSNQFADDKRPMALFSASMTSNHKQPLARAPQSCADGFDLRSTKCTPAFAAPETMTGSVFNGAKADVWSVGVTMFVMLFGRLPFAGDTVYGVFRAISLGEVSYHVSVSAEAAAFVRRASDGANDSDDENEINDGVEAEADAGCALLAAVYSLSLATSTDNNNERSDDEPESPTAAKRRPTTLEVPPHTLQAMGYDERHGLVTKYRHALGLLQQLLARDPAERSSARRACEHTFFGQSTFQRLRGLRRASRGNSPANGSIDVGATRWKQRDEAAERENELVAFIPLSRVTSD